jgi:hypothetical protein
MYAAQLSITDRFVELGNLFFNVKETGREYKYDLHYESTTQDPINRFMVQNEDKLNAFYKYLNMVVDFIKSILSRTDNLKVDTSFTNKSKSYKNSKKTTSKLSSQDVISRKVREKLFEAINLDQNSTDKKDVLKQSMLNKIINSGIKDLKLSGLFFKRQKVVVKNSFKTVK